MSTRPRHPTKKAEDSLQVPKSEILNMHTAHPIQTNDLPKMQTETIYTKRSGSIFTHIQSTRLGNPFHTKSVVVDIWTRSDDILGIAIAQKPESSIQFNDEHAQVRKEWIRNQ